MCINDKSFELDDVEFVKNYELPSEFSKQACKLVNEFIKITKELSFEVVVYFDYKSGEIIKIFGGTFDNIRIEEDLSDLEGRHLASIHNHPEGVYSPPSGKNFGILKRNFEDYELISGYNGLWILTAKGVNEDLMVDLRFYSEMLFELLFNFSRNYSSNNVNDRLDEEYGKHLSKYVNDKQIENLKLVKKEF